MTLKNLEIFCKVYQLESITKAADELDMAQPAVSNCIKELEAQYHSKLFERMNRRIYRTESGDKLYRYAVQVLDDVKLLETSFSSDDAPKPLRIGSNIVFAEVFLPEMLSAYRTAHPKTSLKIQIDNTKTIEQKLINNDIDLAILDSHITSPSVVCKEIVHDEFIALCSSSYQKAHSLRSLTLSELAASNLLMREFGSGIRQTIDELFESNRLTPTNIVAESPSTAALIRLCAAGFGIFIAPRSYVIHDLCQIPLNGFSINRSYYLTYHKQKYLTEEMIDFIEMEPFEDEIHQRIN